MSFAITMNNGYHKLVKIEMNDSSWAGEASDGEEAMIR